IKPSSNNYLRFTSHPILIKAAQEPVQQFGAVTGTVRTIAGTFTMHQEHKKKLEAFKKTEAEPEFQPGITTNQAVLSSILSKEDIVISDELKHGSISDGIRLTKADKK
ncbi:UNVERIFIED_CONTAM: aminotransferase class I/II-fold pyridoxal phosphate-dependent enzyme, partial [Bacillus subtilis]